MIQSLNFPDAKILVVDDNADTVMMLSEVLLLAGYKQVSSCTNSAEVCALHQSNNYDLIILDLHMPGMSGFQVMDCLKKIETETYLPVLAITGNNTYKLAALEAGARDFMAKPYNLHELEMRVHNLLEVRLLYKKVKEQGRVEQHLALHDILTGLPNRRLLMDRFEKALQHAARNRQNLAAMYLDLDGFKEINDTYGHPSGDQLLITVAARISGAIRKEDTVARIGGDEFILLLPYASHTDDAKHTAVKILHVLEAPFAIQGRSLGITASIGIAVYPADGTDVESLIARADAALYEAKNSGKNRFHFAEKPALHDLAS